MVLSLVASMYPEYDVAQENWLLINHKPFLRGQMAKIFCRKKRFFVVVKTSLKPVAKQFELAKLFLYTNSILVHGNNGFPSLFNRNSTKNRDRKHKIRDEKTKL